jgi:PEGA domain
METFGEPRRDGGGPRLLGVAATSLRVDSDVPGASVFLDRRFLGTTPLASSDVEPGSHRLNVSAEGYEGYAEPLELRAGPNEVVVRFKAVRLAEQVAVAHKHAVGACQGVLHAGTAGLRFEPLQVDYLARTLRVKQKGGKTWNFTADSADALLVFQKRVEAARARL